MTVFKFLAVRFSYIYFKNAKSVFFTVWTYFFCVLNYGSILKKSWILVVNNIWFGHFYCFNCYWLRVLFIFVIFYLVHFQILKSTINETQWKFKLMLQSEVVLRLGVHQFTLFQNLINMNFCHFYLFKNFYF